jgi:translocation and assembly module TamA
LPIPVLSGIRFVGLLTFLVLLRWVPAHAQGAAGAEIRSLRFSGNAGLSTSQLEAQMFTRETPGFVSKFLHGSISEALGRKDEFYDPVQLGEDLQRLRTTYQDYGFFSAAVDSELAFSPDGRDVDITIRITEGYRSVIDSLAYTGFINVPDFVFEDIDAGSRIRTGDPYNQMLLKSQVSLALTILRNAGYPNARYLIDSSRAVRVLSTGNFHVILAFDIGRRFVFGPVAIEREGDDPRADITDEVILKQLDYQPGSVYNASDVAGSERNLNRLGLFDVARIRVQVPPNTDSAGMVPSTVSIRPSDKHELAPELILSDENGNFNIGTGLGYKNRNFWGGARTFSTRARFRTQTIGSFPDYFTLQTDAVANAELTFEVLQPSLFTNKTKGTWGFSLILDKQRPYLQFIIRNKFGITNRFAEYTFGYIDWTLERVILKRNQELLANADAVEVQLLRQAQQTQFNSILSFTMTRNKANDVFSPSAGFVNSATIDEAGLLPLLLEKAQPSVPFTQFYRFILYGAWYSDLSGNRFSILALKLRGGLQGKYGKSNSDPQRFIPQTHRFYAGGGSSIRGWASRRLIAGGDPSLELGGDLLFESSLELRINPFQDLRDSFLDKFWNVFFVDAGNVWPKVRDLRLQGIAVAAGLGIRYDTFFGPFRIDYGIRVYDPLVQEGTSRWITGRKFLSETVAGGVFHFGIGHAF